MGIEKEIILLCINNILFEFLSQDNKESTPEQEEAFNKRHKLLLGLRTLLENTL